MKMIINKKINYVVSLLVILIFPIANAQSENNNSGTMPDSFLWALDKRNRQPKSAFNF